MFKLFFNFYSEVLNKKQKFQTKLFTILNILFALFELISVAAIIPVIFLVIGSNLENLNLNFPDFINIQITKILFSENSYLYLSVIILSFFFLKFLFSLYLNLFNIRFNSLLTASLRSKLFNIFLKKKYSDIVNYNSSQITNILTKISELTISNFFISFLLIFRSLCIIIPLIIFFIFYKYKNNFNFIDNIFVVLSIYFLIFKKLILNLGKRN